MLYAKDKSAFRIKILIALVIILIGIICGGGFTSVACAEAIERYSDVLDDLHKDKNFDESLRLFFEGQKKYPSLFRLENGKKQGACTKLFQKIFILACFVASRLP